MLSMMTVVEDVLKQQGKRLNDVDLASRKAEEAGDLDLFLNSCFFISDKERKIKRMDFFFSLSVFLSLLSVYKILVAMIFNIYVF